MLNARQLEDFIREFDVVLDIDLSGDRPQYTAYTSRLPDVLEYGDFPAEAIELLWSSVVTTEEILDVDLLEE